MKAPLRGKSFSSDEALEKVVKNWLRNQSPEFYKEGISDLRRRWDKCVKVKGDYVEK